MPELKHYVNKDGDVTDFYLWHYVPNLPIALIVAGLFALATMGIAFRIVRTRTWFSIAYVLGGILEIIGFISRAAATYHTDKLLPYAIQTILILIAPALFAASIYMVLTRLMRRLHAESLSIVSTKWLTKIFILGDILSFLVQAGGGALASDTESDIDPKIIKTIILVGLFIQVIIFGLYIITSLIFHKRMRVLAQETLTKVNWERILYMLYTVSVLIMIRSIYRIIEYAMGMDSYLFKHEWPTYVLDGVPMLATMFIWVIWYPKELSAKAIRHDSGSEQIPLYEQPTRTAYAPAYINYGIPPQSYGQAYEGSGR